MGLWSGWRQLAMSTSWASARQRCRLSALRSSAPENPEVEDVREMAVASAS